MQEAVREREEAVREREEAVRKREVMASQSRERAFEVELQTRLTQAERRLRERASAVEIEMGQLQTRLTLSEKTRENIERIMQELRSRLAEAEKERRVAEEGREEAEVARLQAERERWAAEVLAESEREEAEQRVGQAEKERLQAQQQRREAERGRREAEALMRREEEELSWVVRREEIHLTTVELGRGAWAVVRVAKFRGLWVAAKCLYQQIITDRNRRLFTREMNVAACIRHPNLLLFVGATIHGELIILTELMPTSLQAVLERGPLTPPQCSSVSLDIATALNYLHLMRPHPIIHREISSANVLLEPAHNSRWKAKVSYYGSANFLKIPRSANTVYAAPEDIFSFGVLLVEMYTAQYPVPRDRVRLMQSIGDRQVVRLIRQCTSEDRTRRPSAAQVIAQLRQLQP